MSSTRSFPISCAMDLLPGATLYYSIFFCLFSANHEYSVLRTNIQGDEYFEHYASSLRSDEKKYALVRQPTGLRHTINSATVVSADANASSAPVCLLRRYFSLHGFLFPG
jgi:hypothetical protein